MSYIYFYLFIIKTSSKDFFVRVCLFILLMIIFPCKLLLLHSFSFDFSGSNDKLAEADTPGQPINPEDYRLTFWLLGSIQYTGLYIPLLSDWIIIVKTADRTRIMGHPALILL